MSRPTLIRMQPRPRLVLEYLGSGERTMDFREAVSDGFARHPRSIPPMFFYDAEGSRLFEQITELPEYYPTRTETTILTEHAGAILDLAGDLTHLVELGSGSATKTRLLLEALDKLRDSVIYTPIDISQAMVMEFSDRLLDDYPSLQIHGLICDYHRALEALRSNPSQGRLFLFLGSSLGNFTPNQSIKLLQDVRSAMSPQDRFLLGLDLKKDPAVLYWAYNDAQGVTAAFNRNLLARINRELGGGFDLDRFQHVAFYDERQGRIEMHLESVESQLVPVKALGRTYTFQKGERIHTENSYKFDSAGIEFMAREAGFSVAGQWHDDQGWFGITLLAPRE